MSQPPRGDLAVSRGKLEHCILGSVAYAKVTARNGETANPNREEGTPAAPVTPTARERRQRQSAKRYQPPRAASVQIYNYNSYIILALIWATRRKTRPQVSIDDRLGGRKTAQVYTLWRQSYCLQFTVYSRLSLPPQRGQPRNYLGSPLQARSRLQVIS